MDINPLPEVEPRTWRNSPADGDRLSVGDINGLPKTVGGGSVHADLKTPRFLPQDFHLGSLAAQFSGTSFTVKAADGTTLTWNLITKTKLLQAGHKAKGVVLTAGEHVFVIGPVVGGADDARLVLIRK